MKWTISIWGSVLVSLAIGCAGDDDVQDSGTAVEQQLTYSSEIRELVERNCTVCHFAGGAAPFAFETYEEVAEASSAMLDAMTSGRMPPWPADPACRTYQNERRLSDEDLARFESWVDEGTPPGEPTDPIVITPAVFEATHTFSAKSPYTPDFSSEGDDYRCFLLDATFDAPMWVQGSTVLPATPSVHHVLVYALDAAQAADAEAQAALEPGEGYTCFGGPLPGIETEGMGMLSSLGSATQVVQLAGWVPGAEASTTPDSMGLPIGAGSRVVMQVHYSAVGGDPLPDRTELQLKMTDTPPRTVMRTVPLAIPALDIPAGEDDVTFTSTMTNWSDRVVTIGSLTGHMHLLGTSIGADVVRADGGADCGLSIPDWDFDWQLSYDLPADDPLVLSPRDGVRIHCTYDNTAENQQVLDGEQLEPQDVQWGEGSLDEMCLVYATVLEPYEAPAASAGQEACASSSECFAQSDGSLSGLLECEATSSDCALCAIQAGTTCGLTPCLLTLASARECVTECVLSTTAFGGSLGRCLQSTCGDAYDQLTSCADPMMSAGQCDDVLATECGLGGGA